MNHHTVKAIRSTHYYIPLTKSFFMYVWVVEWYPGSHIFTACRSVGEMQPEFFNDRTFAKLAQKVFSLHMSRFRRRRAK